MSNQEVLFTGLSMDMFGDYHAAFIESVMELEIDSHDMMEAHYYTIHPVLHENWEDVREASEAWFDKNAVLLSF